MSWVGWIVGSWRERDDALALLAGDPNADPRDELGIGPLRDTLGEAFFPGVTTQQTRAKYFLLVPRMYQQLERERLRIPAEIRLRQLEQEILDGLRGSRETGIIGSKYWKVP